jgi:hypothetical protein
MSGNSHGTRSKKRDGRPASAVKAAKPKVLPLHEVDGTARLDKIEGSITSLAASVASLIQKISASPAPTSVTTSSPVVPAPATSSSSSSSSPAFPAPSSAPSFPTTPLGGLDDLIREAETRGASLRSGPSSGGGLAALGVSARAALVSEGMVSGQPLAAARVPSSLRAAASPYVGQTSPSITAEIYDAHRSRPLGVATQINAKIEEAHRVKLAAQDNSIVFRCVASAEERSGDILRHITNQVAEIENHHTRREMMTIGVALKAMRLGYTETAYVALARRWQALTVANEQGSWRVAQYIESPLTQPVSQASRELKKEAYKVARLEKLAALAEPVSASLREEEE